MPTWDEIYGKRWVDDRLKDAAVKGIPVPGPMGPRGEAGRDGRDGSSGPAGVGVPAGGTTGQVLKKTSNSDYEAAWADATSGGIVYWADIQGDDLSANVVLGTELSSMWDAINAKANIAGDIAQDFSANTLTANTLSTYTGMINIGRLYDNLLFQMTNTFGTGQGSIFRVGGDGAPNLFDIQGGGASSGADGFSIYMIGGDGSYEYAKIPFRVFAGSGNVQLGPTDANWGVPYYSDNGWAVQLPGNTNVQGELWVTGEISGPTIDSLGIIIPEPRIRIVKCDPTATTDAYGNEVFVFNKVEVYLADIDPRILNSNNDARIELLRFNLHHGKRSWKHPNNMLSATEVDTTYTSDKFRGGMQSSVNPFAVARVTEWPAYGAEPYVSLFEFHPEHYFSLSEVRIDNWNHNGVHKSVVCPVRTGGRKSICSMLGAPITRHGYSGYQPFQYFAFRISIKKPGGESHERIVGPMSVVVRTSASVGGKSYPVFYDYENDCWDGVDTNGLKSEIARGSRP